MNMWKIFRLPTPSELGLCKDTEHNALPMRFLTSDAGPTWEDWQEIVKKNYPIRYFLAEELVPWIRQKYRKYVTDPIYWIKCHLLPKHRYHLLDLRQPKSKHEGRPYRYGWIDSDTQMLYALFNILNNFVKHEMPHWYCPSEEEVASAPYLAHQ